MRFKFLFVFSFLIGLIFAYTQSDLLSAQYAYQNSTNKVTQAKNEKISASEALKKTHKNLEEAQKNLQKAQQEYTAAQTRFNNAQVNLIKANNEFSMTNQKLNQIWNSLNPQTPAPAK